MPNPEVEKYKRMYWSVQNKKKELEEKYIFKIDELNRKLIYSTHYEKENKRLHDKLKLYKEIELDQYEIKIKTVESDKLEFQERIKQLESNIIDLQEKIKIYENKKINGLIKRPLQKTYGYIKTVDYGDIFFHNSDFHSCPLNSDVIGRKVTFNIIMTLKGSKAINVYLK